MAEKVIERESWMRWLLYVDIAVFGLLVIFTLMLMSDAYDAGAARANYTGEILRDLVFIAGSVFWLFYRHFRKEFSFGS